MARNLKLPDYILTDQQKDQIRELFNTLDEKDLNLLNITQIVTGDKTLNGQSVAGRSIKAFLGSEGFNYGVRTTKKLGDAPLTEDQKKKLDANVAAYIKKDIGLLELAKIIFENENLTNLHQETRTVLNYLNNAIDKMDPKQFKELTFTGSMEDLTKEKYRPPGNLVQTLARINKYVIDADWKESGIKTDQRKKAESLQRYLNTYSIKEKITSYIKQSYRDTFEDAFVRYTYDKTDLTQEEIDSFAVLCGEKVQEKILNEQMTFMWNLLEQQTQDGEGKRVSKSLVDAITSARTDSNQCQLRQDRLLKNLVQQRSDKEATLKSENATILNLVIPWKQEEFRKKTIHLAIAEKEKLKEEVGRLSSFDEIICLLKGIDPTEMYGDM